MERRNLPEWKWKGWAISETAKLIVNTSVWDNIKQYTWVPVPSSKIKSDSKYDDRLLQVLYEMNDISGPLDIRDMLLSLHNWEAAHENKCPRPSIEDHLANMKIDENLLLPMPKAIIIFDDVITRGANFKAAQILLREQFPDLPMIGLFIARAVSYLPRV